MTNVVKRVVGAVLVAGLATVAGTGRLAAQDKPVTAADAWVALPDGGAEGAVVVANVTNPGMYAIYLVSGETDVAGKVEFRDAKKGNAPQEDVTVEAYGTTYMDPKGTYIFLSGLKRPLKEGETVNITLKTELGLPVAVSAVVKKP